MGIFITNEEAYGLNGAVVACRIQGKQIKNAVIHVDEASQVVFLLQNSCDGVEAPGGVAKACKEQGLRFPKDYKYMWWWDDQVECVKLISRKDKQTTMSNTDKLSVSEVLKLVDLDDDKYLLRKYGIIDDAGDVTDEGQKVLWRIILAGNMEEVVKKLKKLEARKKADKKVKKEED